MTGTCTDNAGNTNTAQVGPVKIDTIAPQVTLISPVDNHTYPQGTQHVTVNFSCSDGGSGLLTPLASAGCVGTQANGSSISLATAGTFTFTVTATDVAGNQTQVTHTYTVAPVN